jgi:hypothetical protein
MKNLVRSCALAVACIVSASAPTLAAPSERSDEALQRLVLHEKSYFAIRLRLHPTGSTTYNAPGDTFGGAFDIYFGGGTQLAGVIGLRAPEGPIPIGVGILVGGSYEIRGSGHPDVDVKAFTIAGGPLLGVEATLPFGTSRFAAFTNLYGSYRYGALTTEWPDEFFDKPDDDTVTGHGPLFGFSAGLRSMGNRVGVELAMSWEAEALSLNDDRSIRSTWFGLLFGIVL